MENMMETAREFKTQGDNSESYITKFMMYWIAFCMIYSENTSVNIYNKSTSERGESPNEWDRIKEYCSSIEFESALARIDLGQFTDSISIFSRGIKNTNAKYSKYDQDTYAEKRARIISERNYDEEFATAIYQTIYQIRCNLFHGGKRIEPQTQMILEAANPILEATLNALLLKKEFKYAGK